MYQTGTDHAVIVKDGRYGLVNQVGILLIEPQYAYLRELSDDLVLINLGADCSSGDCEGGKWGLVNFSVPNTLSPRFSFIGEFDEWGLAKVNIGGTCDYDDCEGGKWGVVDTLANLVLPVEYTSVIWNDAEELFFETEQGWGRFDRRMDSVTIPPRYKSLKRVGTNRLAMQMEDKFGVIDNYGKDIIAPIYEDIQDGKRGYLQFQMGGKFGLMDSLGKEVVGPRYEYVEKRDLQWVAAHNDRWALLDTLDREIRGPVLSEIGALHEDFAVVRRGTTWGVLDKNGQEVIPFRYEELQVVNDSLILVIDRNFHKWFDPQGQVQRVHQFLEIEAFEKKVARVRQRSGWGLINIRGEWLMPPRYDFVGRFESVARGRRKEKVDFCYFDADGAITPVRSFIVMKEEEEEIDLNADIAPTTVGWFLNASRGLWGLRPGSAGRVVIQPQYERIQVLPGSDISLAWMPPEDGGRSAAALVNHRTGKQITDPIFSKVENEDWENGSYARAVLARTGRYTFLTQSGKMADLGAISYMGEWTGDVIRANVGGYMEWRSDLAIDSIRSRRAFNDIVQRTENSYLYCSGGKWGFLDRSGNWVVNPVFDVALDFSGGVSRIQKDGKWGAINQQFEIAVPPAYDYIEYLDRPGEVLLAVGKNTGGYGFMDEHGELVIQPQFEAVGEFHDGLVKIRENGWWGFANEQGEVVIPARYKEVGNFHEGRARFRNHRFWGYIDKNGEEVVPEKYLRAGDFHGGLAWIQDDKFFGFIGLEGQMMIDPAYSKVGDFWEGLAPARRKGNWGLIDTQGKWMLAPNFYRIFPFHDSIAVVQEKGNFGLIDQAGNYLVRPIYLEIGDFSEGLAAVRSGMEFGFVDKTGELKIKCQFPRAKGFHCQRAGVFTNGKWGFIDRKGKLVVENRFSKVRDFHLDRAAVRFGNKWGFIDPKGKMVVPAIYDAVGDFKQGRAAVFVDGTGWGFVNLDGTLVIPPEFEEVGTFYEGVVPVKQEGKWGLMNEFGARMTLFKYDGIKPYREGRAAVLVRRKMGLVSAAGKELLDVKYDVLEAEKGLIKVESEDKIGYYDPLGNWVWVPRK